MKEIKIRQLGSKFEYSTNGIVWRGLFTSVNEIIREARPDIISWV